LKKNQAIAPFDSLNKSATALESFGFIKSYDLPFYGENSGL
jgi:hypothetical protein